MTTLTTHTRIGCKEFMFLLILFFMVNTGCKKEGSKGEQGPPGTANVKYSEWFTPAQYQSALIFGIRNLSFDQPAPEITQAILDSGTVITYAKLLGYVPTVWSVDRVSTLPISLTYQQSGSTQTDVWSAFISPGNLRINFTNNINAYSVLATTHKFRYIIIPGGSRLGHQSDTRLMSLKKQIDNGSGVNYQEICDLFNIPE